MDIYRLPSWVKTPYDMELYHSGVKNMRWGERRYQYKDGSLTPLGRIHYGVGQARERVATLPTDVRSGLSNNNYGSPRASSVGGGSVVVRKSGVNGNIIATNQHGLQGYGPKRTQTLNEKTKIKPKSSRNEDDDIFSVDHESYKDPDLPNVHEKIMSRKQLRDAGATARYVTYRDTNDTFSNDRHSRMDASSWESYKRGRSYLNSNSFHDLQDSRIDSLRAQEVRAIASGYIDSARNSKSSSKLYARLQQQIDSPVNAAGISPYLDANAKNDHRSRMLDEYTKMYEDSNYVRKKRK